MIALQQAIFNALAGASGVGDLVGSRVYPVLAPQDVLVPYIVWQEISLNQISDMAGSAESGGLNQYRIQVTSWARGSTGATICRNIDAQVKLAMIAASVGSPIPTLKSLLLDSRSLGYEADTKLFGYQSDFSVWMKT